MRAGTETALARVVAVFGAARPHHAHAYFKDVLERLPALPAKRISELLPHHWTPSTTRGSIPAVV